MERNTKKNIENTKTVLFIAPGTLEVPNIRGGGIEQNIFGLVNRMHIPCTIFSPHSRLKKNATGSSVVHYSVIPATKVYPPNPRLGLSDLPEVIRLLVYYMAAAIHVLRRSKKLSTIVLFDYFFGTIPLLMSKMLGKKCVFMEYNITPWLQNSTSRYPIADKLQMVFGKLVSSKCSLVTANSPSILKGMMRAGISANKLMLIPTVLDEVGGLRRHSEDAPAARFNYQVAYIGRLVEERGADMLPGIIREVLKRRNDASFVIVGDGPLRSRIEQLMMDEKLAGSIRLTGQIPRESAFEIIAGSAVAIFISRKENFGSLALEECIRMGRPVIATNVGSTRLRIIDGVNGLLADPTSDSIAKKVIAFLSNDKLRLKIESNLNEDGKSLDGKEIALALSRALILGKPIGGVNSE